MRKFWWMYGPLMEAAGAEGAAGGGGGTGGGQQQPAFDPTKFVSAEDFGKTAAKIRGIETAVTDFTKKGLTLDTLVEIGLVERTEDGKYRKPGSGQQQQQQQQQQQKPEDSPLAKEVEKLRQDLKKRDDELLAERKGKEANETAAAVKSALAKAGAVKPDRDYTHLLGAVTKNANGAYTVKSKDQYGNDIETPLEKYAETFLAENPELQKPQGSAGSGTPAGQQAGGDGSKKGRVIPKETWSDMDWFSKNKDKFHSGEFVRGY